MLKRIFTLSLFFLVIAGQVLAEEGNGTVKNNGADYVVESGAKLAAVETLKGQVFYNQWSTVELEPLNSLASDSIISDAEIRRRIGIRRDIGQLDSNQEVQDILQWQPLADGGKVSAFSVVSASAAGLRISLAVTRVPEEAEFRFFALSLGEVGEIYLVTGKQILDLLSLNRKADPENPDASIYWSPVVEGNTLGVEIFLPEGIESENVEITFPSLSHLAVAPFSRKEMDLSFQDFGDSDPCQNDATCYANWLNMRRATAKMIFTDGGFSYICTGTLLNDKDTTTYIPYFISANHCIGSQTVASTLNTLWFFESSSCGSSVRNPSYTRRFGGAALLWTGGMTNSSSSASMDTSFFRLVDQPPGGTYFAGWNTAIPLGTKTGVHHPRGDWKKISFGNHADYYSCYSTSETSFSCSPSATGNFLRIDWTDGGTEGGSSGSGIYYNNDQLIGDLTGGGGGSCAGSRSYYSTFKAAYNGGNLGRWLNTAPPTNSSRFSLSPVNSLLLKE